MALTTALVVGSAVVGAVSSQSAAKKSAKATTQAAKTATDEQARQYNDMKLRNQPFEQLGGAALNDINSIYGRSTGADGTVTSGGPSDMSRFFASPQYQFNVEQTEKAAQRSLLARSRGLSGAAVLETQRNASGLASGEFGNYLNSLYTQAGIGQNAVSATNQGGMQSAANIGNIAQNAGAARSSAYAMGAQGINNAVQGGLGNAILMQYLNPQQQARPIWGSSPVKKPILANNWGGPIGGGGLV
jgi:hypothetical protein